MMLANSVYNGKYKATINWAQPATFSVILLLTVIFAVMLCH